MPRKSTHKLDAYLPRLGKEPDHLIALEAGVSRSLIISFRKKHGIAAYDGYKFGANNPPPAARAAAERAADGTPAPKAPKAPKAAKAPAAAKPAAAPTPTAPAADPSDESFRGRRSALAPFIEMLGKVPDTDIAKLANVTPENVRTYRSRRGIPAAWPDAGKPRGGRPKGSGKPADTTVTAPAAAVPSGTGRSIFTVSVDVGGSLRTYAISASNITAGVDVANGLVHKKHPNGHVKGISYVAEFLG